MHLQAPLPLPDVALERVWGEGGGGEAFGDARGGCGECMGRGEELASALDSEQLIN
jgi:hypothetical protein